jgi:hypothetical protein
MGSGKEPSLPPELMKMLDERGPANGNAFERYIELGLKIKVEVHTLAETCMKPGEGCKVYEYIAKQRFSSRPTASLDRN